MRQLRGLSILIGILLPVLLEASPVTNTVICGGITTTGNQPVVTCSGPVVYATATGSLTQAGNTLDIYASTFSSYYYEPRLPRPSSAPAFAETLVSYDLTTDGPLRAGLAEITFNDFVIRQNSLSSTWAQFTIVINGASVYSCFAAGGGMSQCPTGPLSIPIELGTDFTLQVDDVSSSPSDTFAGGISADLALALLEPAAPMALNAADVAAVPEPYVAGLLLIGLVSILVVKRLSARAPASRQL